MAEKVESTGGVLSHDFYVGPTEQQLEMVQELEALQSRYAELLAANPLFKAAVHAWVEAEHDDAETYQALIEFNAELDSEVEDMSEQEKQQNPDRDLHEMVKLRLRIAELKSGMTTYERLTGVDLQQYVSYAA